MNREPKKNPRKDRNRLLPGSLLCKRLAVAVFLIVFLFASCRTLPPVPENGFPSAHCADIYTDMTLSRQEASGVSSLLLPLGLVGAASGGSLGLILAGVALLGIPFSWLSSEIEMEQGETSLVKNGCHE